MLILIFTFVLEGFFIFLFNQFFNFKEGDLQILSTLLITFNSIVYLFAIRKYARNNIEYLILLFAYFIRMILLYFDFYGRELFVLPNSGLDSEMYHRNGINVSQGLDEGRGGYYSILVGYIYYFFGEQRILAQYLNVLLGVFTIIFIKKILETLNINKSIVLLLILTISFLPNLVVMNAILLRESLIIFLITTSLYYFIKWWESDSLIYLFFLTLLPLLASLFHSGSIAIVMGYILIIIFYNKKRNIYDINYRTVLYGFVFIALFYLINNLYSEILFSKFSRVSSISDISATAEVYTTGGSAYLQNVKADNIFMILLLTPIRMLYFIASPLPWDWRGVQDVFAFAFSGLFYIVTLIYAIKALKIKDRQYKSLLIGLLIMSFVTMMFFSWGVSNSGTALRHREKFISIYVILLGVSWMILRNQSLKNSVKRN